MRIGIDKIRIGYAVVFRKGELDAESMFDMVKRFGTVTNTQDDILEYSNGSTDPIMIFYMETDKLSDFLKCKMHLHCTTIPELSNYILFAEV